MGNKMYIAIDEKTNVVDGNYVHEKDAKNSAKFLRKRWKGSNFIVQEQTFPGLCIGNYWHTSEEGEKRLLAFYGNPR